MTDGVGADPLPPGKASAETPSTTATTDAKRTGVVPSDRPPGKAPLLRTRGILPVASLLLGGAAGLGAVHGAVDPRVAANWQATLAYALGALLGAVLAGVLWIQCSGVMKGPASPHIWNGTVAALRRCRVKFGVNPGLPGELCFDLWPLCVHEATALLLCILPIPWTTLPPADPPLRKAILLAWGACIALLTGGLLLWGRDYGGWVWG